jgi:sporulation protein YlmC with PRC-barrel domain
MKTILTTASLVALMAVPAFAQDSTMQKTTTAPGAQQMAPAKTATYAGDLSAADLMNKSVTNASNEAVGDINDIRIDSSGKVAAVIVGVGGFLGMGEKDVALPFNQLSFTRDADGGLVITAKVTKESLQAAPEWKKPEDRS